MEAASYCVGKAASVTVVGSNVTYTLFRWPGMEAASYCVGKAASVTVVGSGAAPFARSLGPEIGALLQTLHAEKGVVVKNGLTVDRFGGQDGKLTQVSRYSGR